MSMDWENVKSWGFALLTHEELFEEERRYVKDGKLHLVVVIEDMTPLLANMEAPKTTDQGRFSEVFKVITAKTIMNTEMVTLRTADGVELKAFKNVLSKASIVFQKMFEHDMEEKSTGVVEVIDFSGKIMGELLKFVYGGNVHLTPDIDIELFNAAKVYQIEGLSDICLKSIKYRTTRYNVFEVLQIADTHDEKELYQFCLEIIAR